MSIRAMRAAVTLMFFINGAGFANWVARIPVFQAKFALSDGALGLLLTGDAIGVFLSLMLSSGYIARFGARRVTLVAGFISLLMLPLTALAPNPYVLWGVLFLFGMSQVGMDVAMNAEGVAVERRAGRPMLSSFHGTWSIGGVSGAGLTALLAALGVPVLPHFLLVSLVLALLLGFGGRYLPEEVPEAQPTSKRAFNLPPMILWPFGLIAFIATFGEAAVGNWSTVYLTSVVLTDASVAALGYAAFSAMMTIGRLLGDWLSERFSSVTLIRAGTLLAISGLLLALLLPQTGVVLLGFAAFGAGISFMVPLAFSAAGKLPGLSAGVISSGVAAVGYVGFLISPSLVGLIAEATSLPIALLLTACFMLLLLALAPVLRPRTVAA